MPAQTNRPLVRPLALIYARQSDQANRKKVSAESEDSLSLEAQLSECRQLAESEGARVVGEYAEQFTGLSLDDRPAYSRMLREIRANIKRHPDPSDPGR